MLRFDNHYAAPSRTLKNGVSWVGHEIVPKPYSNVVYDQYVPTPPQEAVPIFKLALVELFDKLTKKSQDTRSLGSQGLLRRPRQSQHCSQLPYCARAQHTPSVPPDSAPSACEIEDGKPEYPSKLPLDQASSESPTFG